MASAADSDDSLFEKIRAKGTPSPEVLQEQNEALNKRLHAQHEKQQERLAELVELNSTLPATVSSISVLNATHTRKGFLKRVFQPILSDNQDRPYTLGEALRAISYSAGKLNKFGIFNDEISLYLDRTNAADPKATATDLAVYISVKEKSRIFLKTGADLGNAEGSTFANANFRNIFGGAESLLLNASLGTRTRSAYNAVFETPILSNPDLRWEIGGLTSSTKKVWASHEEVLRGGWTKFRWQTSSGSQHEISYAGFWRQLTGLSPRASPSIRADAGDSLKSSITHTYICDHRDNPRLPSSGYLLKTISEVAGFGPLKGDVYFWKSELDTQAALPIPIPGLGHPSGISFTTGFRAGVLYPFASSKTANPKTSRINDRFTLGGPTDVRGFRMAGLGPHDGDDALGGDVYAAGSANLLFPIPKLGRDHPLRFQTFINGGRLLALKQPRHRHKEGKGSEIGSTSEVRQSFKDTIMELGNGLPSVAAGFGLVYAHPIARFELNFSLPLALRKGEEGRKGVSFGVGLDFL